MTTYARHIHEYRKHEPARPAALLLGEVLRLQAQYGDHPGISADLAAAGRHLADRALREASAAPERKAAS